MNSNLGDFCVNVPRMLRIRGNVSALKRALVGRITAEFLEYLKGNDDSVAGMEQDARQWLTEQNIIIDESQDRIGLTHYGNSLLFDQGAHFEDLLVETHARRGYDRARNRIEGLTVGVLSAERLNPDAISFGREMLSRMDLRGATLAARRQWLTTANTELSEIISRIQSETEANDQRRAVLEGDLASCQRARTFRGKPTPTSRVGRLTEGLRNLLKKAQPQQTFSDSSEGVQRQIERELLSVFLKAALLQAEQSFFTLILGVLRDERARVDEAENLLMDASRNHRGNGESAETSRGWDIAAGDMIVNDRVLTGATLRYLWEDQAALWQLISSRYTEAKGQCIFVATEGVFRDTDFRDIENVVANVVSEATRDWTVVDIIAARCVVGDDFIGSVVEAFRQVAAREFLTVGYDQFMTHRTYATVTYAEGIRSPANTVLDTLLQEVARVVDSEIEIENDHFDNEAVTFYVEDQSVPITAMDFFAESMMDYEASNTRDNLLYSPHPDIYEPTCSAAIKHAGSYAWQEGSGSKTKPHQRLRRLRRDVREARRRVALNL